jgi:hypothetical protein
VARGGFTVDDRVELRHARDLLHLDVGGARHRAHGGGSAVGHVLEQVEVGPEDLHGQVALHARDQLVHPQRNGLRERVAQPRYAGQVARDGVDQLGLVATRG